MIVLPEPFGSTRALTPTGNVTDTGPNCHPEWYRTVAASSSTVLVLTNSISRCKRQDAARDPHTMWKTAASHRAHYGPSPLPHQPSIELHSR